VSWFRVTAAAQELQADIGSDNPLRQLSLEQLGNIEVTTAPAHADSRLVRIVLDNLLQNAWKYTSHHEQARIEFGFENQNGRVVYFVKDDGSGFDPRSVDRLFQPFNRLHSTAEFPGNGIGLATVRRIVQRHGGEVWAAAAVERERHSISHWDRTGRPVLRIRVSPE
jgi:signal transduction histidine kinase